jgi:hypothetical protein
MLISAGKEQWDQLPLSWPPAVLNTCVQVVPPLRPKDHYPVHPHPSTYLQAKIHLRTSSSPILRNLSELGVICIFCHGMRSQSRMTMAGIRGFVPPNLTTLFNEQNLKPKTIFLSSPWWLFPKILSSPTKARWKDKIFASYSPSSEDARMHACGVKGVEASEHFYLIIEDLLVRWLYGIQTWAIYPRGRCCRWERSMASNAPR